MNIIMKFSLSLLVDLFLFYDTAFSQSSYPADKVEEDAKVVTDKVGENVKVVTYKEVDSVSLDLTFYYPTHFGENTKYPVIVFFFGGGWKGGSIAQFREHARYFASRGMMAVLADYRVSNRHHTSPFEAVKDAKSAIRYLRKSAGKLGIDKNRIVASGGSAGGHLAAAAGNISGLEEESEDLTVSSKPDALVLFNPVFDNGPQGYGYDRIGERYPEISPIHNIRQGAPPTIVFLGTEDQLIPVATAKEYQAKMENVGSRCDLFLYEGEKHGFFNIKNEKNYKNTLYKADQFLQSLGYLKDEPTIR